MDITLRLMILAAPRWQIARTTQRSRSFFPLFIETLGYPPFALKFGFFVVVTCRI
jgi:hypothetical protein